MKEVSETTVKLEKKTVIYTGKLCPLVSDHVCNISKYIDSPIRIVLYLAKSFQSSFY